MVNSPLFAKGLLLWCWIPWKFPLIALLSFLGQETVGGLLALVRHHNRLGSLWGQRCSRGSSCQGEGEGGSSCSQRKVEGLINFVCTHGHDYSYYQLTVPPRKDITISQFHTVTVRYWYCQSLKFTKIQSVLMWGMLTCGVSESHWNGLIMILGQWSVPGTEGGGSAHTWPVLERRVMPGREQGWEHSGRRHDKTVPWWIPSYDEWEHVSIALVWSPSLSPSVGGHWRY